MASVARRIEDLLISPRETLEVELKGWLDLTDGDHKAVLAKSLLALANHGGGYVILGLDSHQTGTSESPGRPASLAGYNPDSVNAIVSAYADPPFHCDVVIAKAPSGAQHPIISVPGGHSVPVRCKRDGPRGQTARQSSYYIRRPGPQSETPQTGKEWDELIRRCIGNARDDLVDQIRSILSGGPVAAPVSAETLLDQWYSGSIARWDALTKHLPEKDPRRCPLGRFTVAYVLSGNLENVSLSTLRERMAAGTVRHTGWPLFWVPTRTEIAPYIHEKTLECWQGRLEKPDAAHSDFWRADAAGRFFIVRGLQEDAEGESRAPPGTTFDLTTPTWRVGEAFLHAASMARQLGDAEAQAAIRFEWVGLEGRKVVSVANPRRWVFDDRTSHQDRYVAELQVQTDQIADGLPELVNRVIAPLYELFDFLQLPPSLATEELAAMRSNRF